MGHLSHYDKNVNAGQHTYIYIWCRMIVICSWGFFGWDGRIVVTVARCGRFIHFTTQVSFEWLMAEFSAKVTFCVKVSKDGVFSELRIGALFRQWKIYFQIYSVKSQVSFAWKYTFWTLVYQSLVYLLIISAQCTPIDFGKRSQF